MLGNEESEYAEEQPVRQPSRKRRVEQEDEGGTTTTKSSATSANKVEARRVKNREAAALFRQRQREYIQGLEKTNSALRVETEKNRTKIQQLEAENRLIKDQLGYLRNVVSHAVTIPSTSSETVMQGSDEQGSTSPAGSGIDAVIVHDEDPAIKTTVVDESTNPQYDDIDMDK